MRPTSPSPVLETTWAQFRELYLNYRIRTASDPQDWAQIYGMAHAFVLLSSNEDETELARPLRDQLISAIYHPEAQFELKALLPVQPQKDLSE